MEKADPLKEPVIEIPAAESAAAPTPVAKDAGKEVEKDASKEVASVEPVPAAVEAPATAEASTSAAPVIAEPEVATTA